MIIYEIKSEICKILSKNSLSEGHIRIWLEECHLRLLDLMGISCWLVLLLFCALLIHDLFKMKKRNKQ